MSTNSKISYVFRDAKVPQPYEKKGNKSWVTCGEKNLYQQFLFGLFYNSPIHSGIINSKVKYITSGGLKYEGTDLVLWELIKRNGTSPMTLEEVVNALTLDFEVTDGFYLKCTKDILTGRWQFDILDCELMRNDESGIFYYHSNDWGKGNPTDVKRYVSIDYAEENDIECVLYVSTKAKQYQLDNNKLTNNIYPVPNYAGAITSIMADVEMNSFHYTESVNGFTGGTVIHLNNGIPEDDDKKDIERDIRDGVTDRSKKGGVVILYADGTERQAKIEQINGNDLDKRYLETQKYIADAIMIGHGVISPALFGVKTAGSLGNNQELQTSYAIFKQNYVKVRQSIISQAITYANKVLNGLDGVIDFNEYNLSLEGSVDESNKVSNAINQLSPLVANKVLENLTINEIRGLASLPPIANGDTVPTKVAPTTATFKTQDKILSRLLECGVAKSELTIVSSKGVSKFDNLEADEELFKSEYKIEKFAKISKDDKKILGLIDSGATYNDISKEVGKSTSQRILDLEKGGYLKKGDNGKMEITPKGLTEIQETTFRVLYTYELRDNAPDLVPGGTSREFCLAMLDADRAYTRQEIAQINNDEGTDVWLYRGGWYHNPNTDVNQPSCRHFWKMNLVV